MCTRPPRRLLRPRALHRRCLGVIANHAVDERKDALRPCRLQGGSTAQKSAAASGQARPGRRRQCQPRRLITHTAPSKSARHDARAPAEQQQWPGACRCRAGSTEPLPVARSDPTSPPGPALPGAPVRASSSFWRCRPASRASYASFAALRCAAVRPPRFRFFFFLALPVCGLRMPGQQQASGHSRSWHVHALEHKGCAHRWLMHWPETRQVAVQAWDLPRPSGRAPAGVACSCCSRSLAAPALCARLTFSHPFTRLRPQPRPLLQPRRLQRRSNAPPAPTQPAPPVPHPSQQLAGHTCSSRAG